MVVFVVDVGSVRGARMDINMMCLNSKCKYYWEDCCQKNIEETRIEIDETGQCVSFETGVCQYYKMELEDETRRVID